MNQILELSDKDIIATLNQKNDLGNTNSLETNFKCQKKKKKGRKAKTQQRNKEMEGEKNHRIL